LYSIFVEGGRVNYYCSKTETRGVGWSYYCHSRMRILSGSVSETNSPWSVYFEYAVSYSEPMYVHVHSNIK